MSQPLFPLGAYIVYKWALALSSEFKPTPLSLLADFSEPQVGVIAQDVRKVLPEAVTSGGRFEMADGRRLDEMLIVNKDRLFLGSNIITSSK